MITKYYRSLIPFTRITTFLLAATLVGCGGNVKEELSAEKRALTAITMLFNAVNLAEQKGHACIKTAKYVDSKHLQMAISLSNKAESSAKNPEKKEKLFYKSEKQAQNGLKHINKKQCA